MSLHATIDLSGHTCESGSMAASDGLVPSPSLLRCESLSCAEGEVGLRSFAVSFLLVGVPTGLGISIGEALLCGDIASLLTCDVPSIGVADPFSF
jgi:hypothetical protein